MSSAGHPPPPPLVLNPLPIPVPPGLAPKPTPAGGMPYALRLRLFLRFFDRRTGQPVGNPRRFRLDTGADYSTIPGGWLTEWADRQGSRQRPLAPDLLSAFEPFSGPLSTGTAGQSASQGEWACDVDFMFVNTRVRSRFDVHVNHSYAAVAGGRERDGLLSLKDLLRHFQMETAGDYTLGPGGLPDRVPRVYLFQRPPPGP